MDGQFTTLLYYKLLEIDRPMLVSELVSGMNSKQGNLIVRIS